MRISFLCSSFEPGRDGVGDYVAQFCAALSKSGHVCQVIALCDSFVTTPRTHSDWRSAAEVVRLPAKDWARGDIGMAADSLRRFEPEWTSLQMVCYGYERRGLLLRSARRFGELRASGKRHMMFHELWIGEALHYGLKHRAIGWAQKKLLLRAIRHWSPAMIHTSNPTYRLQLQRNGIVAEELQLPSNIPLVELPARCTPRQWLLERLGARGQEGAEHWMIAGLFGLLHPHWAEFSWVDELFRACCASGRRLVLVQIGRSGASGKGIWQELQRAFGDRVLLFELGEMAPADLSRALQGFDLGIATNAWHLVGKSGAVSAMLRHGLPVVATLVSQRLRRGVTPEPTPYPSLYRFGEAFLEHVRCNTLPKGEPRLDGPVYERFVDALTAPPGRSAGEMAARAPRTALSRQ